MCFIYNVWKAKVIYLRKVFSIKGPIASPNLSERKATIKNLNPREIRQIKMNITILKLIIQLVIVNTLKGNGVKPARNNVPSQNTIPLLLDILF